ncbi:MAG TPA: MAPEG family protein [Luteimonas sp.]|nr:MAPEG family protein [Luteimonas sp.]
MSIAYWCILAAAVLPYLWYGAARAFAGRVDNHDPRLAMGQLAEGRARRANNAQYNAFEAFGAFAAAVLMAQFAGVDAARISQLAIVFVVMRVLHGVFYVANVHALRSLAWALGYACVIWLMVLAATTIA